MPDQVGDRHLLADTAEWDAPAWDMDPQLLPRLSDAIRVLGEHLPQGFTLRMSWTGSEIRHERELSAEQLAALADASQLNEFTRYRVAPAAAHIE